jgi:2-polyprenyl-3-methyl-5-hydroxy-6-metoxy-1,4-benzoquinol methylase
MKSHWENIYNTKQLQEFGWYQPMPATSLALIEMLNLPKECSIIDIGGGDSLLIDNLLSHGFENLSVLDISKRALEKAQTRIGYESAKVNWIEADISSYIPTKKYDLWHDRAVFHFLTEPLSIVHYIKIAADHIKYGGHLIIATFAEDGPLICSGLHIQQYSEQSLAAVFSAYFDTVKVFKEIHKTPSGIEQSYIFAVLRRK